MKRVSKRSERTAARLADLRIFASLRQFAIKDTVGAPRGPAFAGADARRHDALNRAVTARAPELPDAQCTALAGLLDVPWSPMGG